MKYDPIYHQEYQKQLTEWRNENPGIDCKGFKPFKFNELEYKKLRTKVNGQGTQFGSS